MLNKTTMVAYAGRQEDTLRVHAEYGIQITGVTNPAAVI